MARIIVVTSGKGGVGKTTSSAAIATGLAQKGKKTVVIDFDIGLRNLDLIMGCERRVVYDFVNVIQGDATLNQALIKDKRTENLYILPASQTRDKDALTREGVDKVLEELKKMEFDFIVCDSPAGIETGAPMPRGWGWGWPAYCIIRRWMACATGSSVCCWKTSSRIRRRSICCIPLGIWRRLSCANLSILPHRRCVRHCCASPGPLNASRSSAAPPLTAMRGQTPPP